MEADTQALITEAPLGGGARIGRRSGSQAVQGTDLISRRVSEVGKVELSNGALPNTGRLLDRCPTVLQASLVPRVCLFFRHSGKPHRASVPARRPLPLMGFVSANTPVRVI